MNEPKRSLAEKFHAIPIDDVDDETLDFEEELTDDSVYRAYVISRQANRRPEMLNFKFRDGREQAFDYSHLYHVDYSPADRKMTLGFSDHEVKLTGLKLGKLHQRLQSRRILQIAEADSPTARLMLHENKMTVVTEMVIEKRNEFPGR